MITRRAAYAAAIAAACAPLIAWAQRPDTPRALVRQAATAVASPLPPSSLAARRGDDWIEWWRSTDAPSRWRASDAVLGSIAHWRVAAPGVEWAELTLAGRGEGWRTRLIVTRLDPARLELVLDTGFTASGRAAWRLDDAARDARFAVNAGQFLLSSPWGWVVLDGHQMLAAGHGPLVTTIGIDSAGRVLWRHGDAPLQPPIRGVRWAFQSYPTLLVEGEVPPPLQASGAGIDVAHRDARAAIGRLEDGRVIVALTRFDGLGGALDFVPFGLTTPEMAGVMGALGARDAVLLDGGISAQMLVREDGGREHRWPGLRPVPLALVGRAR